MNAVLYVIRHGDVVNPKKIIYAREVDVPLSEEGKASVRDLAKVIDARGDKLSAVYSSPTTRARTTAKILAGHFSLRYVKVLKDLNEVDIPGISKYTLGQLLFYPDLYRHPMEGTKPEKPGEMIARMLRAVFKIVKENKNKVSAAVSHGDPIGFLMWNLRFPQKPTPIMLKMHAVDYLPKGGAWRIEFDEDAKPVSFEKINW